MERSEFRAGLKAALADATGLHFRRHPRRIASGGSQSMRGAFGFAVDWTNTGDGPGITDTNYGRMQVQWDVTIEIVLRVNGLDAIEDNADTIERAVLNALHRGYSPRVSDGQVEFDVLSVSDPVELSGDWEVMTIRARSMDMRERVTI